MKRVCETGTELAENLGFLGKVHANFRGNTKNKSCSFYVTIILI